MLVIYKSKDEVIVGNLDKDQEIIASYFATYTGRDIDDYERTEANDLRINAGVDVSTY